IQCLLGFLGRHTNAVDRVGGQAYRGRDRLRPGIEPRGRADAVTPQLRTKIGCSQTEEAHHDGKQCLWNPVLCDAAHKLWSNAITNGEQEHQEKGGLERTTYLDLKLSDDHRRNQGRGDCSQTKTSISKGSEVVPEGQGQEDRDFRIAAKRLYEPINHDLALPLAPSLCRGSPDPMQARMMIADF